MRVGLVGAGRMGGGIRARWLKAGHEVVVYDADPARSDVPSLEALVGALEAPRVVWVMVPAGEPTEATIMEVASHMAPGDVVIDGGNSNFHDSQRRGEVLREAGLHFVDSGTSGGIWGEANGYCVMVGGSDEALAITRPLFEAMTEPGGWEHLGPVGTGHFVKMVHNGIEYGLMQAYGEGFGLLKAYDTPLDLERISALWMHGSVVRSWLLELAVHAFSVDPDLERLNSVVDDSGEGRWMVQEAVDRAVPMNVIAAALFARFASREENPFSMRVLAALRNEFGGHAVHTS
ncbi:MAG: decarboxylating 6-phosphogluconate dehydrogenase [Dehalococcoidia bacterium]